jgi:hypothetical protein
MAVAALKLHFSDQQAVPEIDKHLSSLRSAERLTVRI